jgi:lysophospholipase L1-like esterase
MCGALASCFLLSALACSGSGSEGGSGGADTGGTFGTGGSSTVSTGGTGSGGSATGGSGAIPAAGADAGMIGGGAPDGGARDGIGATGNSSDASVGGVGGVGGVRGVDGGSARGGSSGRSDASTGDAAGRGGGITGSSDAGAAGGKFSVYIVGDSTVSEYVLSPTDPKSWAGWGQMVQPHYNSQVVTVVDKAVGGMTARHFILGGNLAAVLNLLKAGDYLLVQFGTNDSNTGAMYTIAGISYPYFADANTDFKTYLQQYIDGARAKNAIPVLVTPPPRNSAYCGGGRSLANYGQAMIDLGAASKVAVVDLGLRTWTYLNKICPKPASGTTESFFKVTGTAIDGTHFQENGARIMAGFVADGVGAAGLALDAFRIN